ncbi:hypothetical protein OIU77_009705 [Salix suchowensis]|uniref:Uncharacterized protein n=1 Tax=Salix suchowensis TaxID=1278906 RepID=A0ABQ9A5V0_9ROSI|nr:hypothetical protein OIU77_009705 [Salix suchowensis]
MIRELNLGMDVNFYLYTMQPLLLHTRFSFFFLTIKNSIFMSLYMLINVFRSSIF